MVIRRQSDKVYQDTEKHRHECEVRFVASHDDEWIKDHLEGVKEKRGFNAYKKGNTVRKSGK